MNNTVLNLFLAAQFMNYNKINQTIIIKANTFINAINAININSLIKIKMVNQLVNKNKIKKKIIVSDIITKMNQA